MRNRACAVAVAAVLVTSLSTPAAAQNNTFVPGTAFASPNLTGFVTTGDLMGGMEVTWTFAGLGPLSASWANLGGGVWGVSAGGFSLTLLGTANSFGASWTLSNLTNNRLASVRLNGSPGRTMFDCGWNGTNCLNTGDGAPEGTPGSANGTSLVTTGGTYGGAVAGQYANLIGVSGGPPVGDCSNS